MKLFGSAFLLISLSLTCLPVIGGIDVSLSEEVEKLEQMEQEITQDSPAYDELRRLKIELELLLEMPEERRVSEESRIFNLQREISNLDQVLEKEIRNINDNNPRYFSRAKNRVVVFTYDDPDATGIGDALSFIVSKALLFSAPVSSYGVVNYQGGAESPDENGLAYFDKVDKISSREEYLFSVWGKIFRDGDSVVIDTFGQIDNDLKPYRRELVLPGSMGGGFLQARVNASRFKIHTMTISAEDIGEFIQAAGEIRRLRFEPDANSNTSGRLPEGKAYRIVNSQGSWVQLDFGDEGSGWTSVREFCLRQCEALLPAARFINNFIALTSAGRQFDAGPEILHGALSAMTQLNALVLLKEKPSWALEIANSKPPEAGFASIAALASVAIEFDKLKLEQDFYDIQLDRTFIQELADRLASASLSTPKDLDILNNLAVLFNYLGDEKRRDLAYAIANSVKSFD